MTCDPYAEGQYFSQERRAEAVRQDAWQETASEPPCHPGGRRTALTGAHQELEQIATERDKWKAICERQQIVLRQIQIAEIAEWTRKIQPVQAAECKNRW